MKNQYCFTTHYIVSVWKIYGIYLKYGLLLEFNNDVDNKQVDKKYRDVYLEYFRQLKTNTFDKTKWRNPEVFINAFKIIHND